jgi:MFS superfamily sulfate permease-like transporter
MFDMIAFHIFDWGSLKTMATALLPEKARGPLKLLELKVTRVDSITVVVVAIVSIFTNLAVGVGTGVVVCSLAFAWSHGKEIKLQDQDGKEIDASNIGNVQSTPFKELSPDEQKAVADLGLTEDQWDQPGEWEAAGEWPLGKYKDVAEKEAATGEAVSDEEKTKANAAAELGFSIDNWSALAPKKITRTDMHVIGTMFFGSARVFSLKFTRPLLKACPKHIFMSFRKGEVTDFSAVVSLESSVMQCHAASLVLLVVSTFICVLIVVHTTCLCIVLQQAALQNLADMFGEEGTKLHLVQLSQDSHRMMEKSNKLLDNVSSMSKEEVHLGADITHYVPNRPGTDAPEKSDGRP